jgi:hypothetical protein
VTTKKKTAKKTKAAPVVWKDPFRRRDDSDPVPFERVRVISGELEGREGVYLQPVDVDSDGHAKTVKVDFGPYALDVPYKDLELV